MRRNLNTFSRSQSGTTIVEFALLMPWLVFLFIGTFDIGFYTYLLIATQHAARVAAIQASMSKAGAADSVAACQIVLNELSTLPNVANLSSCGSGTVTATLPVSVTATLNTYSSTDSATKITVKYLSATIIHIPGVLPGQMTITKTVLIPVSTI